MFGKKIDSVIQKQLLVRYATKAFKMLAKSHTEEGDKTGAEEAFNQLENLEEKGEVLLIDGGLI
ncbi:hypothetical protein SHT65_10355 [Enterococcus faecalis]|uniref:hypothetical protein n=1 Tax=Enterococcus TaxID=1350 RepID=UPI00026D76E9|nr:MULTISPECIES: hypothetical protein [Enterococcus]EOK29966.1 hypothetical protein WU9_01819 [Enterococcus faecalis EnGen0334]AFO44564.1 hypothetical protein EFD32_1678 [Enterococcus faecalis D32]EGO5028798.1 hypothetical protein [Enterococcus faecalis]EGO5085238.1 hypothetical protein [Enterococcus faecalis]EGO6686791.1 hypothetical protein [Enterococcus faecalis]